MERKALDWTGLDWTGTGLDWTGLGWTGTEIRTNARPGWHASPFAAKTQTAFQTCFQSVSKRLFAPPSPQPSAPSQSIAAFAPGLIAAKPQKPCDRGVFRAFYLLLKKESNTPCPGCIRLAWALFAISSPGQLALPATLAAAAGRRSAKSRQTGRAGAGGGGVMNGRRRTGGRWRSLWRRAGMGQKEEPIQNPKNASIARFSGLGCYQMKSERTVMARRKRASRADCMKRREWVKQGRGLGLWPGWRRQKKR